jgi:hypothetical protein
MTEHAQPKRRPAVRPLVIAAVMMAAARNVFTGHP